MANTTKYTIRIPAAWLGRAEWGVAIAATALAVGLHFVFLRHGGGLWRDEAGAINLATMPRLGDVWSHLYYDSFPIFWVLVARVWSAVGLGSDFGLRVLGFLTGLGILGALWFNARVLRVRFPLFSLALLGFNPVVLVWCDSLRAWGWGVIWILLTFGLVWRVVEAPSRGRVLLAMLAAVGAVQSTYYNAVLLLAIGLGGMAVAARLRDWRRFALVAGIGGVAAISLLPYLGIFRMGGDHYIILRVHYGVDDFISLMMQVIAMGGMVGAGGWLLCGMMAVPTAVMAQFAASGLPLKPGQRDLLLFALVTVLAAGIGYLLFLKHLQFSTKEWYYAALLAVVAVSLDAMLGLLGNSTGGRVFRVGAVALLLPFVIPANWSDAHHRLTDVDLIAEKLRQTAAPNDLVLVNPWHCGISFGRQYKGPAPWLTLPVMADHQLHRYDIIKQFMMQEDQKAIAGEVVERMRETLRAGNRVWLVGGLSFVQPGELPPILPPAPSSSESWSMDPYVKSWSAQVAFELQTHANRIQKLVLPEAGQVNPLEALNLGLIEGWKEF